MFNETENENTLLPRANVMKSQQKARHAISKELRMHIEHPTAEKGRIWAKEKDSYWTAIRTKSTNLCQTDREGFRKSHSEPSNIP